VRKGEGEAVGEGTIWIRGERDQAVIVLQDPTEGSPLERMATKFPHQYGDRSRLGEGAQRTEKTAVEVFKWGEEPLLVPNIREPDLAGVEGNRENIGVEKIKLSIVGGEGEAADATHQPKESPLSSR
jgi:hypothetical protein